MTSMLRMKASLMESSNVEDGSVRLPYAFCERIIVLTVLNGYVQVRQFGRCASL